MPEGFRRFCENVCLRQIVLPSDDDHQSDDEKKKKNYCRHKYCIHIHTLRIFMHTCQVKFEILRITSRK